MADTNQIKQRIELNQLINISEGATLLCMSEATLRQWIHQRRIPFVKLGKAVRFDPSDLQKFIEENRREVVTF